MTTSLPALVLNVDDNEVGRYTKTRSLQRAEFRVLEARTGNEALQLVRSHRPDLVLLDVKLPDISGLEVCQTIKREFPTILVLQVSASFVTPGDRTIGLESGADSYLTQPVEPEELIAAVRALLRMRRAEQAARDINERYRVIVDSAIDYAIVTTDLSGTVTNWSAGAEGVFGYPSAEIIGQSAAALFTQDDQVAGVPAAEMMAAMREGRAADERWQVRKGGALFWASGQMVPLRDSVGGISGFLKILRDRTGEKQEEEALRLFNDELEREVGVRTRELTEANAALRSEIEQREKAQDALRQAQKMEAVGQLTGGIAHDFNNLLTVVIGGADALQRRLAAGQPDLQRRANMILEAARRAAALTHRLLAFSRQQPLDPKPTDVAGLIGGMLDLLRRTLGEKIEIAVVADDSPWPVSVDRNQLENALLNLAVNARDAMPAGGKLTIATRNAASGVAMPGRPPETASEDHVMLAVTDNGIGMPKDVVDKAFDPFFTTKGIGKGTGLGLSQVYGFVKQSGGHINIDSEPGRGTTIGIYLPRLTNSDVISEPSPRPEARASSATHAVTILVVEDEDVVRTFSTETLRDLGFTVLEAPDAATALNIIQHHPEVKVMFADIGLPSGMNGRALAEEAVRQRPDLKILLTTGYTQNSIVSQGRLDTGVHLLAKPFTFETLGAKMKDVLEG
ncbi:response regulator [Reyranella sp. CPCC 100927]|uniref:response regulator n=1 Tax=Reyranella sp. CPCC 100927 TaxID=2599616 RepID=UPI0015B487BC|nr:response regulator [Reyranella sp. CPCC 100927]